MEATFQQIGPVEKFLFSLSRHKGMMPSGLAKQMFGASIFPHPQSQRGLFEKIFGRRSFIAEASQNFLGGGTIPFLQRQLKAGIQQGREVLQRLRQLQ